MAEFKDTDTARRIIGGLLMLEQVFSSGYRLAVAGIRARFEHSRRHLAEGTVMGGPVRPVAARAGREKIIPMDAFVSRRFSDPEIGHQILLSLLEMEAGDDRVLESILKEMRTIQRRIPKEKGAGRNPAVRKGLLLPFPPPNKGNNR